MPKSPKPTIGNIVDDRGRYRYRNLKAEVIYLALVDDFGTSATRSAVNSLLVSNDRPKSELQQRIYKRLEASLRNSRAYDRVVANLIELANA